MPKVKNIDPDKDPIWFLKVTPPRRNPPRAARCDSSAGARVSIKKKPVRGKRGRGPTKVNKEQVRRNARQFPGHAPEEEARADDLGAVEAVQAPNELNEEEPEARIEGDPEVQVGHDNNEAREEVVAEAAEPQGPVADSTAGSSRITWGRVIGGAALIGGLAAAGIMSRKKK